MINWYFRPHTWQFGQQLMSWSSSGRLLSGDTCRETTCSTAIVEVSQDAGPIELVELSMGDGIEVVDQLVTMLKGGC